MKFWKIPSESASSMAACSGGACASRGRAQRRVGRRSPSSEHSEDAVALELASEERRSRHLVVTSLPKPELQFPPRHPVRRGLEVPAAMDCFRALPPLWLQWLWWCVLDKGDGEFSGEVGCNLKLTLNLKLFLKRKRLSLGERGEFGFGFDLKFRTNSVIVEERGCIQIQNFKNKKI